MAFFDWNNDGKKNYVDNAIEMMIIDDIEADEEFDRALGTVLKIFLTVIASIIFIMNFFSIFFGYVSCAGLDPEFNRIGADNKKHCQET